MELLPSCSCCWAIVMGIRVMSVTSCRACMPCSWWDCNVAQLQQCMTVTVRVGQLHRHAQLHVRTAVRAARTKLGMQSNWRVTQSVQLWIKPVKKVFMSKKVLKANNEFRAWNVHCTWQWHTVKNAVPCSYRLWLETGKGCDWPAAVWLVLRMVACAQLQLVSCMQSSCSWPVAAL